jgi:hypothetical protein
VKKLEPTRKGALSRWPTILLKSQMGGKDENNLRNLFIKKNKKENKLIVSVFRLRWSKY